jgi:hypothetical protein
MQSHASEPYLDGRTNVHSWNSIEMHVGRSKLPFTHALVIGRLERMRLCFTLAQQCSDNAIEKHCMWERYTVNLHKSATLVIARFRF